MPNVLHNVILTTHIFTLTFAFKYVDVTLVHPVIYCRQLHASVNKPNYLLLRALQAGSGNYCHLSVDVQANIIKALIMSKSSYYVCLSGKKCFGFKKKKTLMPGRDLNAPKY